MEELKQETFTEEEIKLARELGLENFDEKPRRKVGVPGVYSDPNREVPAAPPKVIYGESALTSRGYSVHRMVNAIRERDWRYAKVESEVHEILERIGYRAQHGGRLIPLDVRFLANLPEFQKLGLDELWAAGVETRAQGESDLTKGGYLARAGARRHHRAHARPGGGRASRSHRRHHAPKRPAGLPQGDQRRHGVLGR
jgi:hypothetical protein